MTATTVESAAPNQPSAKLLNQLDRAGAVCLAAAALIAAIELSGWLVPAVGSMLPDGWSLMKVNTALCVLLCTACLVLTRKKRSPHLIRVSRACASVAVLLASVALFEHRSGYSTGLGTLVAVDDTSPSPGLMSIQSASCFVLLGLSLIVDQTRRKLLGHVLDVLNVALVMLVLIVMAGYVFKAISLIGQSWVTRMSPQTLVCVVLLSFVHTSRRAPYGFLSVLVGMGIGSHFARIALPFSVALSYLLIYVGERLFALGVFSLENAAAVTASGMAVILLFLIVLLARKINTLEASLRVMSLFDELTGLHNRRGFYLLGEQALRDSRRLARPLTVLFFDVDGLKKVNDDLGHEVGSQLLLDIAALLRSIFRSNDIVGRVGGDEFAVVAHASQVGIASALRRLDDAIEAANQAGNKPYRLSISVGAAVAEPQGDESLAELLDRADAAMYQQKRQRRAEGARHPAREAILLSPPRRRA